MAIIDVTDRIQGLFREGERKVRVLLEEDLSKLSSDEHKVQENLRFALATQMNELSKIFRAEQHNYFANVRKQKEREGKLSVVPPGSGWDDAGGAVAEPDRFNQFNQAQMESLMNTERLIAERDMEMQAIYKSIVDLHKIFKEMNALVLYQGTILDQIDYNITQTYDCVQEGKKEIIKAGEYQKKSRFCLIVGLLGALILLAIFGLMLKVFLR